MSETLSMWTVYDHPKDYPGYFVARRFEIGSGYSMVTSDVMLDVDVDRLRRDLVRMGLTVLSRSPQDDPVIMETWL